MVNVKLWLIMVSTENVNKFPSRIDYALRHFAIFVPYETEDAGNKGV